MDGRRSRVRCREGTREESSKAQNERVSLYCNINIGTCSTKNERLKSDMHMCSLRSLWTFILLSYVFTECDLRVMREGTRVPAVSHKPADNLHFDKVNAPCCRDVGIRTRGPGYRPWKMNEHILFLTCRQSYHVDSTQIYVLERRRSYSSYPHRASK